MYEVRRLRLLTASASLLKSKHIEKVSKIIEDWFIFLRIDFKKKQRRTWNLKEGLFRTVCICLLYGTPGAVKLLPLADGHVDVAGGGAVTDPHAHRAGQGDPEQSDEENLLMLFDWRSKDLELYKTYKTCAK